MIYLLLALAAVCLIGALALRRRTGIPWQRVVYSDTGAWQRNERPLISQRYGLAGKPDYLLQHGRAVIPVEVKPGRTASRPYESDIMQLAAYCLLVEDCFGCRPPHGILRYARTTFRIPFDERVRSSVLDVLDEMRREASTDLSERSHGEPGRCAGCGFREQCDQALV